MPLRIYLADLTHMGVGIATEAFPLNIGLIGSYAIKKFGNEIEVSFFKYPEDLREAIDRRAPHVLGCSNYTWNSNLSYYFLELVKSIDPKILTVFGGTNYPFDPSKQREFLLKRPQLDCHTFYEAEIAFSNVIEKRLSCLEYPEVLAKPIAGCQFIQKESGEFFSGPSIERIKDLDSIPSPYATGLLDRFFDGRLAPLLETARGCPFTCNFCNAGNSYFNRVDFFSDQYVQEEWQYVAQRASRAGVGHLTLADNNFGMIPRDYKTAELMHRLQERYGWPLSVTAWTGKNSKQRVIDVTRILKDTLIINMAVQSMDSTVLKKIERSNIRLDHYRAISEELNSQGRPQVAELIVPLPGETWISHLGGIRNLLDSQVSTIVVHTLQMLHGTPYKDNDAYIREYGFIRKYRVVPLDFGTYNGRCVFDTEEVAVATNAFSLEDYLESRKLLFVIDLCYNGTLCEALKKYIRSHRLLISDWIEAIYRETTHLPAAVKTIFDSFTSETLNELWDSEEELIAFYSSPEHYQKLLTGEAGGNVLYKHKTWMLSQAAREWLDTVFAISEKFLEERLRDIQPQELEELKRFTLCRMEGAFQLTAHPEALSESFSFDLPAWLTDDPSASLGSYHRADPIWLSFTFSEEQVLLRQDALTRYGTQLSGMVKLIQRLGGIQRLTRRMTYGRRVDVSGNNRAEPILG